MKQNVTLDDIDRRILVELQKDGSLSHSELAERVGSSGPSCWRRIKALETSGLLKKSVRLVDAELLGCGVNVLCNIRMRSHSRESLTSFEEFVASREEVMECFSMSGDWDYLLRVVASDVTDYEQFLMHTLLGHPSVANASSHFVLSIKKYTTGFPIKR
jgi:Lrp/AsnC family transcriptional regulator